MTVDQLPSQFQPYNELRKELEGKIEKKLEGHIFYWVAGILFTILLTVFLQSFNLIFKMNDHIQMLNEKLTRIEVKLESFKQS
jgi:hypothetical protein